MAAETASANSQIASLNTMITQMNAAAAVQEQKWINEYSELQAIQSTTAEQESFMQTVLTMLASSST
jgi:hypothetical protein